MTQIHGYGRTGWLWTLRYNKHSTPSERVENSRCRNKESAQVLTTKSIVTCHVQYIGDKCGNNAWTLPMIFAEACHNVEILQGSAESLTMSFAVPFSCKTPNTGPGEERGHHQRIVVHADKHIILMEMMAMRQ
jgi:hypothetical protein